MAGQLLELILVVAANLFILATIIVAMIIIALSVKMAIAEKVSDRYLALPMLLLALPMLYLSVIYIVLTLTVCVEQRLVAHVASVFIACGLVALWFAKKSNANTVAVEQPVEDQTPG